MRKRTKHGFLISPLYRIVYEPDYSHEAWEKQGACPTPETEPDAFYKLVSLEDKVTRHVSNRRDPHETLSRTAIRKRLSITGYRGAELKRLVDEIAAGPVTWPPRLAKASRGSRLKRRLDLIHSIRKGGNAKIHIHIQTPMQTRVGSCVCTPC